MEKAFEHIGRYDFWSIFGSGVIFVVSFIINALSIEKNFNFIVEMLGKQQADWSLLLIFILVVASYFVGIILHTAAKLLFRFIKIFSIERVTIAGKFTGEIPKDKNEFERIYDKVKHSGETKRIDKYHSLFGMSRSLFVGVILLTVVLTPIYAGYLFNLLWMIGINSILAVLLFARTKEYYDRWVKCVIAEYELCMKEKK